MKVGPYSQFGLRKALRRLQGMGYSADGSDHSVLVRRIDEEIEGRKVKGKDVEE